MFASTQFLSKKPNRAFVVALCAMSALASAAYAAPASDNAANAAYANGWQSGDNGGSGFLPWELLFSGAAARLEQPGPHFIDIAPPLPANRLGSPAFGLTTSARQNMGDTSEAHRRFIAPFAVGETFMMDVDGSALNPDVDLYSAGNVIQFLASDDTERFGIFTNNGFEGDNWVTFAERRTGVPANSVFRFEFTLRSTDRYDFAMRPIGGGAPLFSQINAPLGGTAGVGIDHLVLATYGNGSSADGTLELFFNNMLIVRLPSVWNVDTNGNWANLANWIGLVPNAAGAVAIFGDKISAPRTVTVNVPATVGRIEFDNANAYRLGGSSMLTLDATSGNAAINVIRGSHSISAPLIVADNAVMTVSSGNSLSISGAITASGVTLTKEGAGRLQVNHLNAAALAVANGTVALQANGGTPVLGRLSIAGTPTAPTAKLDLNNAALAVDYPAAGPNPQSVIRQQIISGRGTTGFGATWTGTGITSSTAAADVIAEPESRSVAYANNGDLPLGAYTNFRGATVDNSTVLIRYTRTADANLDGVVNDDDVTIVGATYAPRVPNPSWALGDFDYNGFVDDDDVTLLGVFYNPAATPISAPAATLSSADVAGVPEPATILLAAIGLVCLGLRQIRFAAGCDRLLTAEFPLTPVRFGSGLNAIR